MFFPAKRVEKREDNGMDQRFSMVTLGVADLARATAFYSQGLGWKPAKGSCDEITFFQMGSCILGLFPRDELAKDAGLSETPPPTTAGITISHNVSSTAEVDQVMADAERAGAKIIKPAETVFWGGYSGYFTDPDGHAWEVAHNPNWPIGPNGEVIIPA
jgi:catechol 2,3-dioxygenase-like lactoylglutathione lyase family enzyme